ncbi:extracellular solute-binding protein [Paenibacillus sp. J5C_2022]|uniref:extracellular solute-binding protein n=1 Tax=Paenibacillus sp. J5C2022 TaxID=2977129 RepID=UPI0021D231CA|nr:extracellular solute-binding protein [Paenibacillus sp. J5C2022]MCU6708418.1 extracellular solute-binding protein [Paenibacillus sp. J5C2022]
MRNRSKVVVIGLISVLLGVILLAACSNEKNIKPEDKSADQSTDQSATTADPKRAATFNVLFAIATDLKGLSLTDNIYNRYIKERTGVEIKLESPGMEQYYEKLNILLASGQYPDAFMTDDSYIAKMKQLAADGLLEDLAPYINDTARYPNIKKNMPADAWLPVSEGDNIWAFPFNRQDGLNQVVYIRKDWLDNLGLEVPTSIDEYYKVLKAFAHNDPDGNGKDDTYGLLVTSVPTGTGGRVFKAAFDAERYRIVDGKVTPPEILPEYKELIKFLSQLVKEKIMDNEFPTITTPIFRDKIKSGKYGMFVNFWHLASGNEIPKEAMDKYTAVELPLMNNGEQAKFKYVSTNRHYIAIPKQTKDIDRLMDMFDWALSPEGTKYTYLGVEGVNYNMVEGKVVKEGMEELHILSSIYSLVKQGNVTPEVQTYMESTYAKSVIDNLVLGNHSGEIDRLQAMLPPFADKPNLDKITIEFVTKAVLGNIEVDSAWDDYVKRWREAGGDKAIQIWTEWYNANGSNVGE